MQMGFSSVSPRDDLPERVSVWRAWAGRTGQRERQQIKWCQDEKPLADDQICKNESMFNLELQFSMFYSCLTESL